MYACSIWLDCQIYFSRFVTAIVVTITAEIVVMIAAAIIIAWIVLECMILLVAVTAAITVASEVNVVSVFFVVAIFIPVAVVAFAIDVAHLIHPRGEKSFQRVVEKSDQADPFWVFPKTYLLLHRLDHHHRHHLSPYSHGRTS